MLERNHGERIGIEAEGYLSQTKHGEEASASIPIRSHDLFPAGHGWCVQRFVFFYDVRKKDPCGWVSSFVCISIQPVFPDFYFLHYLMIGCRWRSWADPRRNSISSADGSYPALITGLGRLAFLETLLLLWEKHESKYSLEWWLCGTTSRLMRRWAGNQNYELIGRYCATSPSHESKFLSIIIAMFAKRTFPVLFPAKFYIWFPSGKSSLCSCLIFL